MSDVSMSPVVRHDIETCAGGGRAASGAAGGLGLAAAPTFAIMALWTGLFSGQPDMLCMAMQNSSPMSGMTLMYLLMSLFHTAPCAQQPGKLPTIGFLGSDASAWSPYTAAFVQRLRELGWIEGRTIAIEYRWSEGRSARNAEIAAEFVRMKVDVIVTNAFAASTVKQATSVIPIVFPLGIDPVGSDLIRSLAQPGGNVTGVTTQQSDLAGKRLELLREVLPRLSRLAIIGNVGFPQAVLEMDKVQGEARALGLEVTPLEIRRVEDIAPAFESLRAQADALYVVGDAFVQANRTRIITFSLGARLPTIVGIREFVHAGALMSYGPHFSDQFRRAAELVDKILRGTKPGDIPVEQPTKFSLVINLTTAKVLGLKVPEALLLRADEVIE